LGEAERKSADVIVVDDDVTGVTSKGGGQGELLLINFGDRKAWMESLEVPILKWTILKKSFEIQFVENVSVKKSKFVQEKMIGSIKIPRNWFKPNVARTSLT
jgi:hypothetical protein